MAALRVLRLGIEDLYIFKNHIYWYSQFGEKDTEICQRFGFRGRGFAVFHSARSIRISAIRSDSASKVWDRHMWA